MTHTLFAGVENPGRKVMERICTPPLNGGLNCTGESVREKACAGDDDAVFRSQSQFSLIKHKKV